MGNLGYSSIMPQTSLLPGFWHRFVHFIFYLSTLRLIQEPLFPLLTVRREAQWYQQAAVMGNSFSYSFISCFPGTGPSYYPNSWSLCPHHFSQHLPSALAPSSFKPQVQPHLSCPEHPTELSLLLPIIKSTVMEIRFTRKTVKIIKEDWPAFDSSSPFVPACQTRVLGWKMQGSVAAQLSLS